MAKKRSPRSQQSPVLPPPPELQRILCDLQSPDERVRAGAVRELCPCRGVNWGVPVFPRVLELRNDPSPIVRHAVQHDLSENPAWGERQELRRLEGLRRRREIEIVKEEIEAGDAGSAVPALHSLAWRRPRRPRVRKGYYPPGKR